MQPHKSGVNLSSGFQFREPLTTKNLLNSISVKEIIRNTMEKDGYDGLRAQLEMLDWPNVYMYKFIVPLEKAEELLNMFQKEDTTTKVSRNGNYISVTAKPFMYSAEKVIERYKEANRIEGIIML